MLDASVLVELAQPPVASITIRVCPHVAQALIRSGLFLYHSELLLMAGCHKSLTHNMRMDVGIGVDLGKMGPRPEEGRPDRHGVPCQTPKLCQCHLQTTWACVTSPRFTQVQLGAVRPSRVRTVAANH